MGQTTVECKKGSIERFTVWHENVPVCLAASSNRDCRLVVMSSVSLEWFIVMFVPFRKAILMRDTGRAPYRTEYPKRHHYTPSKVFRNESPSSLWPKTAIVAPDKAVSSIEGLRLRRFPGSCGNRQSIEANVIDQWCCSRSRDNDVCLKVALEYIHFVICN